MYIPKIYEETRTPVLHELIRSHPFGALVAQTADGLDANHVPWQLHPQLGEFGVLRGHVARANPIWRTAASDADCLVIFQGPHAYISPGWLPSKQQTGKVVPTWNYALVHVYGRLRFVDTSDWLREQVTDLSARHEAGMAAPWQVSDAPADYTDRLLAAIGGVEVEITRLHGKWKLDQRRNEADAAGMLSGLEREGGDEAAALARLTRDYPRA